MSLTYCKNNWVMPLFVAGMLVASAFLFVASGVEFVSFAQAQATQDQIDAAIGDLSSATGQDISTKDQAKALCNQEQYLDVCADIGKKYNLYTEDEVAQVDAFLNEVKGQVLAGIKACQDEECLIRVANQLAQKIQVNNPTLATNLKLTTTIIEQKNSVVQAAKEVGVSFRDCEAMDPDTAPVDLLRKCARLAKDQRVQNYIPEEKREFAAQFEDSATIKLREALAAGKYQCGDGTLEGCGNFCLNPSGGTIPPVCSQIASEIFGEEGVKKLEAAHQQVGQVKDYYSKKFILTLPDGSEIVGDRQIRERCDRAFSDRNLEVARACGNFAVKNGFASQAEVDRGLKLMESFTQKGQNVNFDDCLADPASCRDFLPDDEIGRFDVGRQIFEIMRTEIGFDPQQCERGAVDEAIGTRCLEGSKRALAKIESLGLANQSQEARFIIEDIKRHVSEGDILNQRKDEFRQVFNQQGGPGGCRSEAECFAYCSDPANGPECISFGAQQGVSGFQGEGAIERFNKYNQNIQRPGLAPSDFIPFSGQGPYPGFQPPGQGGFPPPGYVPGFTQPGPEFGPPPGTSGNGFYPGLGPARPSPECFAAIQSGDFVRAKTICASSVLPQPTRFPVPQNPTYSPGPEFTPSGDPALDCQKSGGAWDSVARFCKFPEPAYSPGPSYSPGPYPTNTPPSGQREQIWNTKGLRSWVRTDADPARIEQLKQSCANVSNSANIWLPGAGDFSSSDFGMPDPVKCQKAAACTSDQYFDGASCAGALYSPGPSPTYSPYPTSTGGTNEMYSCFYPNATKNGAPTGYTVWCERDYFNCHEGSKTGPSIALTGLSLGAPSSCESGYSGSCNYNGFCDSIEDSASCPSDCGGATYSPYPTYPSTPTTGVCPSGYHYHSESGGFCINDQENYGGTCYDSAGTNRITCPQPTYSPYPFPSGSYTPPPSCPSGQWWDTATNSCKSTTFTCPSNAYTTSNSSCDYTACPNGCNWESGCPVGCYDSSTSPAYTPYSGYCGDNVCNSNESSSTCPADCGGGATYTPYPTFDPATECANSGGSWDGSTCVFPTPPPPAEEPPPPTSGIYPYYMAMHCRQLDRTWNGEICEANGLFARFYENSGMANILRLFYIVP